MKFGYWRKLHGYITPGGEPLYACGRCGGSEHLNGVEFPKRKLVCDVCGRVNIYPYEQAYEQTGPDWEDDTNHEGSEAIARHQPD